MLKWQKQDRKRKKCYFSGVLDKSTERAKGGLPGGREEGDGELLIYEFRDSLENDAKF